MYVTKKFSGYFFSKTFIAEIRKYIKLEKDFVFILEGCITKLAQYLIGGEWFRLKNTM